ncbi:MAG: hypothetical protein CR997_09300 [Acidobacteria bacterium]|nr:MAG: hypothetical protein CR997_09300 [Acidobacteriota bacterium]
MKIHCYPPILLKFSSRKKPIDQLHIAQVKNLSAGTFRFILTTLVLNHNINPANKSEKSKKKLYFSSCFFYNGASSIQTS